jgi:uncharacterized protein
MPSEIAMPFRLGTDGRVVTVSDPDALVRQHVLALVNTQPGERVMLPQYGVGTAALVFEDDDVEDISARAATMVSDAFTLWEPGVRLASVMPVTSDDRIARVDVTYSRLDSPDTGAAANSNTAIIAQDGTVKEQVRG